MSQFHSISSFINGFNGGLRPNTFVVTIDQCPIGSVTPTFHVTATNLPASKMTTIGVPYRGRTFKIPGVRTYDTWQITVINDKPADGQDLYRLFHQWSNQINNHGANITTGSGNSPEGSNLLGILSVEQLDYNGVSTNRKWKLLHAWPSNVGQIALNMETTDSLSTFIVDIEFSELQSVNVI